MGEPLLTSCCFEPALADCEGVGDDVILVCFTDRQLPQACSLTVRNTAYIVVDGDIPD